MRRPTCLDHGDALGPVDPATHPKGKEGCIGVLIREHDDHLLGLLGLRWFQGGRGYGLARVN